MAEITRAQCPGCAASIADDGYSAVLTCAYCGTRVTVDRPRTPPRLPAPRKPTERELLLDRLVGEQNDWEWRIRAAERPGAADYLFPLLGGAATMFVLFLFAVAFDATIEQKTWAPLAGCAFWLSGPLVAIAIHRLMSRGRQKRALVIARHRDEALTPLRARIAQLEKPQVLTEKQRRVQALQFEREHVRRQLDQAYLAVEEARTSGIRDIIVIPAFGCGVFFVLMAIVTTILYKHSSADLSLAEQVLIMFGPWIVLLVLIVVPLTWRWLARRFRVARLEQERDATAPKLQQRLNEIESELGRLT